MGQSIPGQSGRQSAARAPTLSCRTPYLIRGKTTLVTPPITGAWRGGLCQGCGPGRKQEQKRERRSCFVAILLHQRCNRNSVLDEQRRLRTYQQYTFSSDKPPTLCEVHTEAFEGHQFIPLSYKDTWCISACFHSPYSKGVSYFSILPSLTVNTNVACLSARQILSPLQLSPGQ